MLTDVKIKRAKPQEKPYRMTDGRGLSLQVEPTGSRLWRFRYRQPGTGKEGMISLGAYPDVGLKEARELRDAARKQVAAGVDPASARRVEKEARGNTFRVVMLEWLEKQELTDAVRSAMRRAFERHVFPDMGDRPVSLITSEEVLRVLRKMEAKGKLHMAVKVRARIGSVMRYAKATGRGGHDVTADLKGTLKAPPKRHHASIKDPARVGELLRAIDVCTGQPSTVYAMKILPYVYTRSTELRGMRWEEVNLETGTWLIPAGRMKMRREHIVPLAQQVVKILVELYDITGYQDLCFPCIGDRRRPIVASTLRSALYRMGYTGEEQTIHGFRSIASTLLNGLRPGPDLVEAQLAHSEVDESRSAYNAAEWLDERRVLMQIWADYLDALRGAREPAEVASAFVVARAAIQASISSSTHPTAWLVKRLANGKDPSDIIE